MEQRKEEKKTEKETENENHTELEKNNNVEIKTIQKDPLMTIDSEKNVRQPKEVDEIPIKTPAKQEGMEMDNNILKTSLDEKTKLADECQEKLMRLQAEFENYQKRSE
jgi:hypothetical protein